MLEGENTSLWQVLSSAGNLSQRFLAGAYATVKLSDLTRGSSLLGRAGELRGRSVLIKTKDQLAAGLALIELDGVARRLVLCPPELQDEHLEYVAVSTEADAVVCDHDVALEGISRIRSIIPCRAELKPAHGSRKVEHVTEWVLLTSGTTGSPKMLVHSLNTLAACIDRGDPSPRPPVWSTFYDIRRYGGIIIFLRALLTGASMVLSSAEESVASFLERAAACGVTHMTGTPSYWRRALMSPAAATFSPQYTRMSGEIADQAILDHLIAYYPQATVTHAFASTEAGVGFAVHDGLAGFPATLVGQQNVAVEMKVIDGSLRIRSARIAQRYLGDHAPQLRDASGFHDTGDMVELRSGRYYFVGRRDGTINVAGNKVHPEEVEAVINRHPRVRMSLVRTRKNPITGALVVADVVFEKPPESETEKSELRDEILQLCRSSLSRHKVPIEINIVSELKLAATGKMARHHA